MIDDHVERKMILNGNDWQQCSEKLSVEYTIKLPYKVL